MQRVAYGAIVLIVEVLYQTRDHTLCSCLRRRIIIKDALEGALSQNILFNFCDDASGLVVLTKDLEEGMCGTS